MLCSGMGVAMLVMAAGLHLKQLASLSSSIAITGTVAYMVFFALGAGPVPGLLVPEITPARLRGEPPLPSPLHCRHPMVGFSSFTGHTKSYSSWAALLI